MDWFFYAVALPVALVFLASAVYAFFWSVRHDQLKDFEKGAASIFDSDEPTGRLTDTFPLKSKLTPRD